MPADLPSGYGDERRLTQVVLNLVGNAIKFTDVGEVVIKATKVNGSFESPCVIPARAFPKPIEPSFSKSFSKPTIRSRAKREAPA
jgi:signal transduction histidine kinase